ncbi:hypothetical protein [Methylobacterium oryzihabitans]|uniref:Uncharacterized protein n=1 Tax=Methylobacterium oryzihabitans TaxID=2499852 RepID=A0A3S2W066_9HYPH|nr:hypothetical protein [Methylobacterium oryzihabitans]RVU21911.1 hypothetical protein EOE48_02375 [Methylobacterium oryzihabitans]
MDDGLQILVAVALGASRAARWLWNAVAVLEGLGHLARAGLWVLHGTGRLLLPCATWGQVAAVPVFSPGACGALGSYRHDGGLVLGWGWAALIGAAFWAAALALAILRA